MPDNKNQNQGQGQGQGKKIQGDQGNIGRDREQDVGNVGRQQQGNRGQQGGKSSREIERENMDQVSNDNDLDQDLDEDLEEGEITQRNPRVGDQGEQEHRGGQGGMDRNRNRE
jgi:hypothetical protein